LDQLWDQILCVLPIHLFAVADPDVLDRRNRLSAEGAMTEEKKERGEDASNRKLHTERVKFVAYLCHNFIHFYYLLTTTR